MFEVSPESNPSYGPVGLGLGRLAPQQKGSNKLQPEQQMLAATLPPNQAAAYMTMMQLIAGLVGRPSDAYNLRTSPTGGI